MDQHLLTLFRVIGIVVAIVVRILARVIVHGVIRFGVGAAVSRRRRPRAMLAASVAAGLALVGCAGLFGGGADDISAGAYKVGRPYQENGRTYYPAEDFDYDETGLASWYGSPFHGRRTASGERFDMNALTAAHPTLPMPSIVRVTNLDNGRDVVVRINDRGPFVDGRIIDLSRAAAQRLDMVGTGTARVRVVVLSEASRKAKAAALNGHVGTFVAAPQDTGERPRAAPRPAVQVASLTPPQPSPRPASTAPQGPAQTAPTTRPATAPPAAATSDSGVRRGLVPMYPQPHTVPAGSAGSDDTDAGTAIGTDAGADLAADTGADTSADTSASAAAPPPAIASRSAVYIQTGAYRDYDNAVAARERVATLGLGATRIQEARVRGVRYYRVRVGPFANRAAATARLDAPNAAQLSGAQVVAD